MRKIITILALVLTVALCASFAASADTIKGLNSADKEISATVNEQMQDRSAVYSVDVAWSDVLFTYDLGTTKWDPASHSYTTAAGQSASWEDAAGKVTVTNHSNAAVTATVSFVAAANSNAQIAFDGNNYVGLPNAEGKATDAAELSGQVGFSFSGAPNSDGKIGTLTVTITAGN